MKTTRTKTSTCPNCEKKLDAHDSLGGDHSPAKGDISMCLKCGQMLEFQDPQTVIKIRPETLAEIRNNPTCWNLIVKSQKIMNSLGP